MVEQFDDGRHWRAKLGFIVLANEETVEDDIFTLRPPGVGVHISRVHSADEIRPDVIECMRDDLRHSAELLLPGDRLDVICFTCSGGTMAMGEDVACKAISEAKPDVRATTVIGASVRALKHIGAKKISVLTPYPAFLDAETKKYLGAADFEILSYDSLRYETNSQIVNTSPEFLYERVVENIHFESDAIFICCGALRSLEIIARLERRLGLPVIASNQAMMWDALRLSGVEAKLTGFGKLLSRLSLPKTQSDGFARRRRL